MKELLESKTKSFDLSDQKDKVNIVKITVNKYTDNGEDYFYQISYIFDKNPLFLSKDFNASLPLYKNLLTENLVEFLLMDYDLLEFYLPINESRESYQKKIINSIYSLSNL